MERERGRKTEKENKTIHHSAVEYKKNEHQTNLDESKDENNTKNREHNEYIVSLCECVCMCFKIIQYIHNVACRAVWIGLDWTINDLALWLSVCGSDCVWLEEKKKYIYKVTNNQFRLSEVLLVGWWKRNRDDREIEMDRFNAQYRHMPYTLNIIEYS